MVRAVGRQTPTRLSREAWVDAALALLASDGSEAVRVEPLARRMRVTKGSFYWHFRDRRELLTAALRRWEEVETLAVRDAVEAGGGTARERLRRLFAIAFERRTMALEVALRSWAARDRGAREAVVRVDGLRLAYLRDLYEGAGLARAEAEARGFLAYATLFGESFVRSPGDAELRASLIARSTRLLLRGLSRVDRKGSGTTADARAARSRRAASVTRVSPGGLRPPRHAAARS
jgi:AcrR family transcriptional regulator